MCGRFWIPDQAIENATADLDEETRAKAQAAIKAWVKEMNRPRYDVRPTNQVPIITPKDVQPMRWGFKTDKSNAVFNARVESLRYPIWRENLVLRRAIVPAGGFYEWTGTKGSKQAHAIHRADHEPMLLGAIWTTDDELGPCFSIITTPATKWMEPLHNRMPLILDPPQAAKWLDLTQGPKEIKAMIQPYVGELSEFACPSPKQDLPPKPIKGELF
jgi:putative SOS response-associated peptidase YedK